MLDQNFINIVGENKRSAVAPHAAVVRCFKHLIKHNFFNIFKTSVKCSIEVQRCLDELIFAYSKNHSKRKIFAAKQRWL